jgi:small conductance mechanosensitive channel
MPPTGLFQAFFSQAGDVAQSALWAALITKAVTIALTIGVAVFALVLSRRGIAAAFRRAGASSDTPARAARLKTLGGLISSTVSYVIFFVAALMVLGELGANMGAVLTTAGVLGLAVGLGSQRLVRDVIGGFFLLLEDQFSIGETVTLGGSNVTGTVQEMGMRVTRLRDELGRLVIVANGDITVVTNHSRGPLTVTVDLTLPGDADLSAARHAIFAAANSLPSNQWAEPPRYEGLLESPEGKMKVRVRGRAAHGRPETAEMALRAALRKEFEEQGFPP